MAKKRVVVLYGGRADEHSISCISTAGVLGAMDTERFEPIPVGITKDGKWIINGEDPRGWNLDGGELPTVKITPESRPVMLDPVSRTGRFTSSASPATSIPPIPASAPASSACPTRENCTMC